MSVLAHPPLGFDCLIDSGKHFSAEISQNFDLPLDWATSSKVISHARCFLALILGMFMQPEGDYVGG